MDQTHFDASVGLAIMLNLFAQYRKSGILRAELRHVPGISGSCKGSLQLVEGKVTSCVVEEKGHKAVPIDINVFINVDAKWGPFEWVLVPFSAPPASVPHIQKPDQATPNGGSIPHVLASLKFQSSDGWTIQQQTILQMVYDTVNGQRAIDEIKKLLPFAPNTTEDALRILVRRKVLRF